MKEAVLKLSGEGISKDLKTVLTGQEQIETQVNMEKNYIYSIIYG
jgi:phosphopantetheinyl transferase